MKMLSAAAGGHHPVVQLLYCALEKLCWPVGCVTAALNAVVSPPRDDASTIYLAASFVDTRHVCRWGTVGVYTRILVLNECASALKRNHTRYDLHNRASNTLNWKPRARNPLFFIIGTLLFLLSKNSLLYPALRQWALLLSFIVSDLGSMANR